MATLTLRERAIKEGAARSAAELAKQKADWEASRLERERQHHEQLAARRSAFDAATEMRERRVTKKIAERETTVLAKERNSEMRLMACQVGRMCTK